MFTMFETVIVVNFLAFMTIVYVYDWVEEALS